MTWQQGKIGLLLVVIMKQAKHLAQLLVNNTMIKVKRMLQKLSMTQKKRDKFCGPGYKRTSLMHLQG